MQNYEIKTKDQQTVGIEIEDPHPTFKSCFAFGTHKGGSTLLFDLLRAICHQYHQVPYVSVADALFLEGSHIRNIDPSSVISLYTQDGYCFGGFRDIPNPWIAEFLPNRKKIILLRDPRDILVSWYYSAKYSHRIPEKATQLQEKRLLLQELDINSFVMKEKNPLNVKLASYRIIEDWDLVKVFRYEDVILSKRQWINDICEFLELPLNEVQIQSILDRYDLIPTMENQNSHIRRVVPGDHKEKLNPQIIEQLNETFSSFLSKYNYEI